jgi:hypothetical protein
MYKQTKLSIIHRVIEGRKLFKKPQREETEIDRLNSQIEELRCAIGSLIVVVSILSGSMILQWLQSFSIYSTFPLLLFIIPIIATFLLAAVCSVSYKK